MGHGKQPLGSELGGRVALVTAGSRSIGRAIAERMLADGASVVISGRDPEKGAQALKEMDAGDRAAFFSADARRQDETEALVDFTLERYGHVDILVNNAGGSGGFAPLAELTDEAWKEANDWILNSAFWTTRRALPSMIESQWGRIINISSVEGKHVLHSLAGHYATFKHALHGLTRAVAVEYGPVGITCNAICPGVVETDLTRSAGAAAAEAAGISYEAFLDGYATHALTKKINTVEEVAAVAALLASHAGAGITGTTINVDGGTSPH
jgi:3-hydroxybutyrate dehydrogenase/3-oxoacyl-[acyl-carrier protein] reductase